jgi:K+-sensing histidine kinase KdpD
MLLFHKFQQAGNSLFTRDTTKGTGLGLYISKLMIEGMGGTIGLQYSQPGKGSAFGFALPVAGSVRARQVQETIAQHTVAQKAS